MLGTDVLAISRRDPDDSLIHGRLRSPVNGYLCEERSVSGDVGRAYFVAKKPFRAECICCRSVAVSGTIARLIFFSLTRACARETKKTQEP